MSTTVVHPRSAQPKRPFGSTVVAIVTGVALAAALGYGIATSGSAANEANPALSALRNEAGVSQVRNPALDASALRNEAFIYTGLPRTDAHWSGQADIVNGSPLTLFPRTDSIWSGQADVINGAPTVTRPEVRTYGPQHMSYADLVAFEGAEQSSMPRTDEHWAGTADVVNGSPTESVPQRSDETRRDNNALFID